MATLNQRETEAPSAKGIQVLQELRSNVIQFGAARIAVENQDIKEQQEIAQEIYSLNHPLSHSLPDYFATLSPQQKLVFQRLY